MSDEKLTLQISEIISKLNSRFRHDENFDAFVAYGHKNKKAELKYFYPDGRLESISRCKAIGGGAPHGELLLKAWNTGMSMERVAELAYCIIKCIEDFELDTTVGVGNTHPQIWYIPDNTEKTQELTDRARLSEMASSSVANKKRMEKAVRDSFGFFED